MNALTITFLIFAGLAALTAVLYLLEPKCPRCKSRAWRKGLWPEWQCRPCGLYYDHLDKTARDGWDVPHKVR